jgi:tetratricopeptide (TPR) repeat protein
MTAASYVSLDDAYKLAKQHWNAGNLIVAERAYRDILQNAPTETAARHSLGLVCWFRGKRQEARDLLAQAVGENPHDAGIWNGYAIVMHETGHAAEAVDAWRRALDLAPGDAGLHGNLGLALVTLGENEEAVAACRRALELDPTHVDAALNLGRALEAAGRLDEAVPVWEELAARGLPLSKVHANLGNAYRELGRPLDAEEACRKAIELEPKLPYAHNNLGIVLLNQGRADEAEEAFERATEIDPRYHEAHANIGIARHHQGRFEEAARAFRHAIAVNPDYATAHAQLGTALQALGNFPDAEAAIQQALYLEPDEVDHHLAQADMLIAGDRADEAEAVLSGAVEMAPESATAHVKLSRALGMVERHEDAIAAARTAVELQPEAAWVHHGLAQAYFWAGNDVASEKAALRALELQPGFATGHAWIADFYQTLGETEAAERHARTALELDPNAIAAYGVIAQSKSFDADDLAAMERAYEHFRAPGVRGILCFALARGREKFKDYEGAFTAYKEANDTRRRGIVYNSFAQEQRVARTKSIFTAEWMAEMARLGQESALPVFIVGMPRSGTTLTEQIIASHPEAHGAGELPLFGQLMKELGGATRETLPEIGRRYVETLQGYAPDARRVTDKMPGNFANLAAIAAALPNATIIHCRRDPVDTCLSCYQQNFARGQHWSFNLKELGEQYRMYRAIMAHWRQILPGRFLEIDYEDLVGDTETAARRLITHVGLDWHDDCLSFHESARSVRTASKMQVRQPIYGSSVAKWRRYESQLGPLLEALGDIAPQTDA